MQRAAQRDDRAQRGPRATRLSRALVCAAAVPAVLITAACSSDSGDAPGKAGASAKPSAGSGSGQPSAKPSPTVQASVFRKLPEPCKVLPRKTLGDLVPEADTDGKKGSGDDTANRSSCSWTSLDNNGVKGSQFRWLNVSLLRFDSDTSRGSGNDQAHAYYTRQVQDAKAASGAKNTKSEALGNTGDEATAVHYDLKKKEGAFKQQTVVARVENVVITLDYNGAGLAGDKTPDADDLTADAKKAAKEAVTAVASANGRSAEGSSPSADPSKGTSKSPSPKGSASSAAPKKG
ncbi:DUF3558 domain-containing protein [Streptomyces griseoluteus]|uniref:DUF3558 domain-containing protein n=1 Tax=Streptomyces griseoluteus TaxID=29306 RepID=UPI00167AFF35|nr:DUF3558 domain-containing protein [Streptomyces griseoluteus]GHF31814.1 hypothetical protein GCM10017776_58070 [Streptomyces griseoluteus]